MNQKGKEIVQKNRSKAMVIGCHKTSQDASKNEQYKETTGEESKVKGIVQTRTAGVYLLIRLSPLLEYSSTGLLIISWLGALTALFAATIAVFQNDLKRVIAYSTMSQLG